MAVQWKYDELPFDHFEVESSGDPAQRQLGPVFYRIKVILKNGNIAYSKIISINNSQQKHFNISANPSPFHQALHLTLHTDKDRQVELNLFDLYGRKLLPRKWNCASGHNQYDWQNVSSLPKSVYYITARSDDELLVKRIVRD